MNKTLASLVVVAAFSLSQGLDEWPIAHNIGHTGFSPTTVLKPPLKVKWSAYVAGLISGESGNGPVVAEGKVLIQGHFHNLVCMDAETGELLWRTSIPEREISWHFFPCVALGKVYAVFSVKGNPAANGIRAFNLNTGDLIWKQDAGYISGFRKKQSPQVSNGRVFLSSIRDVNQSTLAENNYKYEAQVQAWNAETGDTLWTYTMGDSLPLDQYGNPGDPNNSFCVVGDTVFASFSSGTRGKTVALDRDGNVLWSTTQYYVDGYTGSIQYTGDKLLIPGVYCCSNGFYALNPRNGSLIYAVGGITSYSKISAIMDGKGWNRPYGGPPGSFDLNTGAGVTGCRLLTNDDFNSGCAAPRAANGYIYAGLGNPAPNSPLAAGHTLFAWDDAGNPVWWFRTEINVCQDVAIAYDKMYWLTNMSGMVYCFENDTRTVTSLEAFCEPSTLEQYASGTVKAVVSYSNGDRDTTNMSCYFASLDAFSAVVTVEGKTVTANNTGTARIRVTQYGMADTLEIPVVPTTATLDSIILSHGNVTMGAGESLAVTATGYFHDNTRSFSAVIDTFAEWSLDSTGVATVEDGLVCGLRAGGPASIIAAYRGKSAGLSVTVKAMPVFLKRINFQVSATPFKSGWLADNGGAYSSGNGYGWLSGNGATRDDRGGSNFLLKSFVIGDSGQFKINAPDGDYILRIGMGDNVYGVSTYYWAALGNDTLCRKPIGLGNSIETKTITITGGQGITLTVEGAVCYLILCSAELGAGALCEFANDDYDDPACGTGKETLPTALSANAFLEVSPNPFNHAAVVRIGGDAVSAGVFDIRGSCVGKFKPGPGTFTWNAENHPAGVYMVVLKTTSGKTLCRKMTLMK